MAYRLGNTAVGPIEQIRAKTGSVFNMLKSCRRELENLCELDKQLLAETVKEEHHDEEEARKLMRGNEDAGVFERSEYKFTADFMNRSNNYVSNIGHLLNLVIQQEQKCTSEAYAMDKLVTVLLQKPMVKTRKKTNKLLTKLKSRIEELFSELRRIRDITMGQVVLEMRKLLSDEVRFKSHDAKLDPNKHFALNFRHREGQLVITRKDENALLRMLKQLRSHVYNAQREANQIDNDLVEDEELLKKIS